MLRKPWPIIFMSLIFFLIPIFNIIATYFFLKTDYSFSDYIYSLAYNSQNYFPLFNMVVPSLIAGIAVYCVKKWSYPVFFVSIIWITGQNLYNFIPHMKLLELFLSIVLPMIINFLYVSYILLPEVRATYLDPRLRWWETKPRYVFSTDIKIGLNGDTTQGKMTNISEGGLFSLLSTPIEPNTLVDLKFEIFETDIELKAKIVYRKSDGISHGIQFVEVSRIQRKILKKIIAKLANDKYEETRPVPLWTEDLALWFKTLIKTGKGLLPEVLKRAG